MDQIFSLSKEEQVQIYQEAAARSKDIKSPIIIEKDFWVCWALKHLFSIPEISPYVTFKGGTSLSKCYDIIKRFSEDCDLTLDKQFLGIDEEATKVASKGRKQKDKFCDKLSGVVEDKVINVIKPILISEFKRNLDKYFNYTEWAIEIDPSDNQNLLFHYPSRLAKGENEYIQSVVKLEFGGRGDSNPNELKEITPYACKILPEIFDNTPSISIPTLTAQRTFWEKITLLHIEHHRPPDKPLKSRIFRHYYDVTMLNKHGIAKKAMDDIILLDTVISNNKSFFYSAWANYSTVKIGTIKLLPNEVFIETLRQDCNKMSEMFFGETPDFNDIMTQIAELEKTINSELL